MLFKFPMYVAPVRTTVGSCSTMSPSNHPTPTRELPPVEYRITRYIDGPNRTGLAHVIRVEELGRDVLIMVWQSRLRVTAALVGVGSDIGFVLVL